jgi:diacylglycerol kinase family enzyme
MDNSKQKVFVVFNPKAGKENQADEVRAALARHFIPPRWVPEIYETTGKEDVAEICRAACARGASLVISAGGDGTLVGVANGLLRGQVPLGIIPLGTLDFLARGLQIPMKIDDAVELLVSEHVTMDVDALEVGTQCYFSNISVGMSPEALNETTSADKKLFGRLAYLMELVKRSRVFQLRRYMLRLDGRPWLGRATDVMVSSTTLLEKPPLLFGPPETLGDGQMEVYVVTARTLGDYLRLLWDVFFRSGKRAAKLSHWTARKSVRIDSFRRSSMVQADGEMIGRTPVEIHLVPGALHVIMPRPIPIPEASGAAKS